MVAKTGVARLALATGVPVDPGRALGRAGHPALRQLQAARASRARRVHVLAGPPVDLSEFAGKPLDTPTLRAATDKIMADVAALLGRVARRGAAAPRRTTRPWPAASSALSCASWPRRSKAPDGASARRLTGDARRPRIRGRARRTGQRGRPGVKAAVMGAGSWGTTFAQVLCDAGTPTMLWCRRPELAQAINATTRTRLPAGLPLTAQLQRDGGPGRRRWTAPTWWCSRCPPRRCGRTWRLGGAAPAAGPCWSA